MATLTKRIETLEQCDHTQDAVNMLLRHLGVDVLMPSKTQRRETWPQSLDDELIAALIRGGGIGNASASNGGLDTFVDR